MPLPARPHPSTSRPTSTSLTPLALPTGAPTNDSAPAHGGPRDPPALVDFSGLWPVIAVGGGSRLTLRGLAVQGIPPSSAAAGSQLLQATGQTLFPSGQTLFPSVVLEDGAQVRAA